MATVRVAKPEQQSLADRFVKAYEAFIGDTNGLMVEGRSDGSFAVTVPDERFWEEAGTEEFFDVEDFEAQVNLTESLPAEKERVRQEMEAYARRYQETGKDDYGLE